MVAACWSPATPRIGIAAPNSSARSCRNRRRSPRPRGSIARGTSRIAEQLVVPVAGLDVEQQRARGVGRVGGVHLAAGQPPDQEAVDRAESKFAALGARAARPSPCRAARRSWCRRNKGRAAARSCALKVGSCPSRFSLRHSVGGAPVLPDDARCGSACRSPVPDDDRLALVGDADAPRISAR